MAQPTTTNPVGFREPLAYGVLKNIAEHADVEVLLNFRLANNACNTAAKGRLFHHVFSEVTVCTSYRSLKTLLKICHNKETGVHVKRINYATQHLVHESYNRPCYFAGFIRDEPVANRATQMMISHNECAREQREMLDTGRALEYLTAALWSLKQLGITPTLGLVDYVTRHPCPPSTRKQSRYNDAPTTTLLHNCDRLNQHHRCGRTIGTASIVQKSSGYQVYETFRTTVLELLMTATLRSTSTIDKLAIKFESPYSQPLKPTNEDDMLGQISLGSFSPSLSNLDTFLIPLTSLSLRFDRAVPDDETCASFETILSRTPNLKVLHYDQCVDWLDPTLFSSSHHDKFADIIAAIASPHIREIHIHSATLFEIDLIDLLSNHSIRVLELHNVALYAPGSWVSIFRWLRDRWLRQEVRGWGCYVCFWRWEGLGWW
ncbi:hypothetical protein BDV97DRAFT_372222 [Delphinella strobiligena]|nr:hypothetical protein BDV97DRAFT_372222 [Delphinella strobiligena]